MRRSEYSGQHPSQRPPYSREWEAFPVGRGDDYFRAEKKRSFKKPWEKSPPRKLSRQGSSKSFRFGSDKSRRPPGPNLSLNYDFKEEQERYKERLPKVFSSHEESRHHTRSPACLLTCTTWVLDIEECEVPEEQGTSRKDEQRAFMMDPKTTRKIATIRQPMIGFKHCSFGSSLDQRDLLDHLVDKDRFSSSCFSSKTIHHVPEDEKKESLMDHFIYDEEAVDYLSSYGAIAFPIRNKSKAQNSHITNFRFEAEKKLKQETFTLCFSMVDPIKNKLMEALKITDGMTGRQFMFKIQGYLHGQTVFSDHIHYLLKGGKLMRCTLDSINEYRVMSAGAMRQNRSSHTFKDSFGRLHSIPTINEDFNRINFLAKRNFLIQASNLPKQFGFEIQVRNLHFDDKLPILAKNLTMGHTFVSKLFFVFNLNEVLIEENQGEVLRAHVPASMTKIFQETLGSSSAISGFPTFVPSPSQWPTFHPNHQEQEVRIIGAHPSGQEFLRVQDNLKAILGKPSQMVATAPCFYPSTKADQKVILEDEVNEEDRILSMFKSTLDKMNLEDVAKLIADGEGMASSFFDACSPRVPTNFLSLLASLPKNPETESSDSDEDEGDESIFGLFRGFREVSWRCHSALLTLDAMCDINANFQVSLSALQVAVASADEESSSDSALTCPDEQSSNTSLQRKMGSTLTFANQQRLASNRLPLYSELRQLHDPPSSILRSKPSHLDTDHSWFAAHYSFFKNDQVSCSNQALRSENGPYYGKNTSRRSLIGERDSPLPSFLAYFQFERSPAGKFEVKLAGVLFDEESEKEDFWHLPYSLDANAERDASVKTKSQFSKLKNCQDLVKFLKKQWKSVKDQTTSSLNCQMYLEDFHPDFFRIWSRKEEAKQAASDSQLFKADSDQCFPFFLPSIPASATQSATYVSPSTQDQLYSSKQASSAPMEFLLQTPFTEQSSKPELEEESGISNEDVVVRDFESLLKAKERKKSFH